MSRIAKGLAPPAGPLFKQALAQIAKGDGLGFRDSQFTSSALNACENVRSLLDWVMVKSRSHPAVHRVMDQF